MKPTKEMLFHAREYLNHLYWYRVFKRSRSRGISQEDRDRNLNQARLHRLAATAHREAITALTDHLDAVIFAARQTSFLDENVGAARYRIAGHLGCAPEPKFKRFKKPRKTKGKA